MAHLCALYERYGTIPDKPKFIYKKIVNLLIEEWDSQRMILRKSSFANFTPDRKTEFLAIFAFKLTSEVKSIIFTKNEISRIYRSIHDEFSLKQQDEKHVILELESQTGLFLQSGNDSFEFAHKSLQEYLAAEYIVRLPVIPSDINLLSLLPNELAIATALSMDPSMYFAALVLKNFAEVEGSIVRIFLTRLLLENPDFRTEPLLGAAVLYIRGLHKVKDTCDNLIYELIRKDAKIRESIIELSSYYRRNERESSRTDQEITLHNFKSQKKFNVETPIVIRVNKTILSMLNIDKWK